MALQELLPASWASSQNPIARYVNASVPGLLTGLFIVFWASRTRRREAEVEHLIARGPDPDAEHELGKLARGRDVIGETAKLALARWAYRAGELSTAEKHLTALIEDKWKPPALSLSSPLADALSLRAAVRAMLGNANGAHRDLAALPPVYRCATLARYRVQLAIALRAGDIATASDLASKADRLPLDPREEMLTKVALALGGRLGAAERLALTQQLTRHPRMQALSEQVAPGSLDALSSIADEDAPNANLRIATPTMHREEPAEQEQLAEAEAEASAGIGMLAPARARS